MHKYNVKATWKVLNGILKKNTGSIYYPNYFVNGDNQSIKKEDVIVNEFNKSFVNVGCKLAERSTKSGSVNFM